MLDCPLFELTFNGGSNCSISLPSSCDSDCRFYYLAMQPDYRIIYDWSITPLNNPQINQLLRDNLEYYCIPNSGGIFS